MRTAFLCFVLLLFIQQLPAQLNNNKYELKSIGRQVNTHYHEAGPTISVDGKKLFYFVSNHPENTYGKEGSQDIWYSELQKDGTWGEAQHLEKPLNQSRSNQVFTVFNDGSILIRGGRGKNSKGFSFSQQKGSAWTSPEEIKVDDFKKMNLGRFYGASMTSDKKVMVLYFSEKESSKFSDLYVSFVQEDGTWSRPKKLGAPLNTARDEFGPFISGNNKTMYYASSRKDMGLGSADVYRTERLDDTWMKWSEPVNIGPPVNTPNFDGYYTVDGRGNIFTTKAKRLVDGGNLDIFGLVLKKTKVTLSGYLLDKRTNSQLNGTVVYKLNDKTLGTLKTNPETGIYETLLTKRGKYTFHASANGYKGTNGNLDLSEVYGDTTLTKDFLLSAEVSDPMISGIVYNAKTKAPLQASVQYNMKEGTAQGRTATEDGYYEFRLKSKSRYILSASAEGFITATDSINITEMADPVTADKDFYLDPIEIGTTVRLNNIFFDFDKIVLKTASFPELDRVVEFMEENASVAIEIEGHTDNKGTDAYNEKLSQGRADAVMDYLIEQGIAEERVRAKGYGESQPKTSNDTESGRAINRRVVFTVVKK